MERKSFETHRNQVWIFGETWIDGQFSTHWMQLHVTIREAQMWTMYEKRDWGSGRQTWRPVSSTIPRKTKMGQYAMRRLSGRKVKQKDLMASGVVR